MLAGLTAQLSSLEQTCEYCIRHILKLMPKTRKWHQVHCVGNRNVSASICTPSSCFWLMRDASDKHAMSFPKPGLSINNRQDEIQVPIRQFFISHSKEYPAQRNSCCCFFFAIRRTRTSDANKRTKVNCLTDTKKVNNKEEIHEERSHWEKGRLQ